MNRDTDKVFFVKDFGGKKGGPYSEPQVRELMETGYFTRDAQYKEVNRVESNDFSFFLNMGEERLIDRFSDAAFPARPTTLSHAVGLNLAIMLGAQLLGSLVIGVITGGYLVVVLARSLGSGRAEFAFAILLLFLFVPLFLFGPRKLGSQLRYRFGESEESMTVSTTDSKRRCFVLRTTTFLSYIGMLLSAWLAVKWMP